MPPWNRVRTQLIGTLFVVLAAPIAASLSFAFVVGVPAAWGRHSRHTDMCWLTGLPLHIIDHPLAVNNSREGGLPRFTGKRSGPLNCDCLDGGR